MGKDVEVHSALAGHPCHPPQLGRDLTYELIINDNRKNRSFVQNAYTVKAFPFELRKVKYIIFKY